MVNTRDIIYHRYATHSSELDAGTKLMFLRVASLVQSRGIAIGHGNHEHRTEHQDKGSTDWVGMLW